MKKSVYIFLAAALIFNLGVVIDLEAQPTPASSSPGPSTAANPSPPVAAPTASAAGSDSMSVDNNSGLKCTVLELRRTKYGTVKLKFSYKNTGTTLIKAGNQPGVDAFGKFADIRLRDMVNRLEYQVMYSSASGNLASSPVDIQPGGEANYFAEFNAPPEKVQSIMVVFNNGLVVEDVPIH